jgi:chemotaxis response regulator CheB
LIQHLDLNHASMMVDLLAGHTPMTVQRAADGMPLEPDHVYLIFRRVLISLSAVAPCCSLSHKSGTVRACPSTSSCARWRKSSATARSA